MRNDNQEIAYVVVADGSRARIFLVKKKKQIALKLIDSFESQLARTHNYDLGSKKPHGIFERNTPELRINLHKKEAKKFINHLAKVLNKMAETHQFHNLILILPPASLGELRKLLGHHIIESVIQEINKDLTHMDEQALKDYI